MTKWIIIGVIVVVVLGGGSYLIFHKSSTPKPSTTTNSTTTTSQTSTNNSIIQTKTNATVGQYLADTNGDALYTYGADTSGVSNCSGSCLYSWPAYVPTSSLASLPTNLTIIKRSDGSSQYAYKGMPLYTFTGDSAGHVTGDNVSDFHVAKP